jgi:hypothetical protein
MADDKTTINRSKDIQVFGDKRVSITDLKRNKFMLYSRSLHRITEHPAVVVTNVVRNILLDYILKKQWHIADYNRLDEKDKKQLNDILQLCGVDYELGVDTMDQSAKDIQRFELLKGEMVAGNDSKEIIRELQLIVLRLVANRRIPRARANEIMFELVSLL